jgi:hypothetical protein
VYAYIAREVSAPRAVCEYIARMRASVAVVSWLACGLGACARASEESASAVARAASSAPTTAELAREPVPLERTIRGTVTDPVGRPTFAFVQFVWRVGEGFEQRPARVDRETGRFEIELDDVPGVPGETGALVATTYRDRFAARVLEPIAVGTQDVGVRLREPRTFELEGREPDGTPVVIGSATFHRRVLGAWLAVYPGPTPDRDRKIRWPVPDVPFRVEVRQFGYEDAVRVVDDPAEVRKTVPIELVPLTRVAGVVEAGGLPVGGASVRLEYRDPRPQPADVELEDLRPRTWRIGSARTDAAGVFAFPTEVAGRMRLSASHDAHGQASLDVEVDSGLGATGIVLALDRPLGAIEGRVFPPSDRTAGDVLLAFAGPSQGYSTFYVTPDAAGWFRASGLASGTWAIRVMPNQGAPQAPPDEKQGFPTHSWPEAPDWLAEDTSWLVELAAGETRAIDVDLGTRLPCRLAGSLLVDGAPLAFGDARDGLGYWPVEDRHAFLEAPLASRAPDHIDVARAKLDAAGLFELATREPGAFRLRLEVNPESGGAWRFVDRVRLERGEARWALDVRTGSVRVRTADPALTTLLADSVRYRWRGPGEIRAFLSLRASPEHGAFVLRGLPAGRGELHEDLADERRVLARFDVEPGRTIDVELP